MCDEISDERFSEYVVSPSFESADTTLSTALNLPCLHNAKGELDSRNAACPFGAFAL